MENSFHMQKNNGQQIQVKNPSSIDNKLQFTYIAMLLLDVKKNEEGVKLRVMTW